MNENKNRVYLFDTTLRDGEQSPGVSLDIDEKLEIAHQLARLGVDAIEAGFPVASPGDFRAVKAIADEVKGPAIVALSRSVKADIDRSWEAIQNAAKPRIHVFLASSDLHLKYKLGITRAEMLRQAAEAVHYACSLCSEVEFSAEDASRTDIDFLIEVTETVIDAGASIVNLPDTVGYAVPGEYGNFIKTIHDRVKNMDKAILSVHCHDDLGMATANSLAGVLGGARQIECAVNGIGERAGNASLEEIIMALYTRKSFYQKDIDVVYQEIYPTSRLVSSMTGMMIQPNKAIVGANAFAHESGIHQDGVLKNRATYEIMNKELLGINTNNIVLGKHSGSHAFQEHLKALGFTLSPEEQKIAFRSFKELTDKKKTITDGDIEAIVKDNLWSVPERFSLDYLHTLSGSSIVPSATVVLSIEGKKFQAAANGSGPVEAACHAVDKITDLYGTMLNYKLNSVGSGKDALGEVAARIKIGGDIYNGRGLSTDIIEASVLAYINAINKYYHASRWQ